MSNQEKLAYLTKDLSEAQLAPIVTMIEGYLSAINEAIDDAFCMRLLEEARNDPDKSTISEEEFLKELGLEL